MGRQKPFIPELKLRAFGFLSVTERVGKMIFRRKRVKETAGKTAEEPSLKREVNWFGSFAMGYADVGADIYIAIGLVTLYAGGFAPLAFLIASITYICTGLAYAELSGAYPYAGGAHVYAMKAFNDFMGFLSGWTVLLDYTICIALFGLASAGYISFFFPAILKKSLLVGPFSVPCLGIVSLCLILLLIIINITGIRESSFLNEILVGLSIVVEGVIILLGIGLAFKFGQFFLNLKFMGAPGIFPDVIYLGFIKSIPKQNFIYGITLAMCSFIGIESIAQAAEETRNPTKWVPRAFKLSILSVIIFAIGLSVVSMGMMPWETLAGAKENPIAKIAGFIPYIGKYFAPIVAITGAAICLCSTNTGVIGVSRIVFSMSRFRLLPKWFYKTHPRFKTPYRSIILFGLIGASVAFLGHLTLIADLYNFGALFSYMIVNLSLIMLRTKEPDIYRPFRCPWNISIRIKDSVHKISLVGIIGFLSCLGIWLLVITFHHYGRILGFAWLGIGILMFTVYRHIIKIPVMSSETKKIIYPSGYTMRAIVLIRPPENEDMVISSLKDSFLDSRFQLTLLSVIDPADWGLTNEKPDDFRTLEKLKEKSENDLDRMAKRLKRAGFQCDYRVEVGKYENIVSKEGDSPLNDIIIVIKSRTGRWHFEKDSGDNIYKLLQHNPAKLLVIRKH